MGDEVETTTRKITRWEFFWVFVMQHTFAILWGVIILVTCLAVLGVTAYTPATIVSDRTRALDEPPMDNTTDRLFWFSQVSDLHISIYYNYSLDNFRRYVTEVLPVVRPAFIITSGDLTDGFDAGGVFRPQQIEVRPSDSVRCDAMRGDDERRHITHGFRAFARMCDPRNWLVRCIDT